MIWWHGNAHHFFTALSSPTVFVCEEIHVKKISDVVPHHAISSWICVKFWISMVCSLISKSPNFIFIGIHYGGVVWEYSMNRRLSFDICYFIKYLTLHLRTLENILYSDYLWIVGYVRTSKLDNIKLHWSLSLLRLHWSNNITIKALFTKIKETKENREVLQEK